MPRTIAAVFAHPDDETFATGGTLAKYASEGHRIVLYCATDGDAGKSSGIPVSSRAELGALRREECKAACRVLGIGEPQFGGYPDGELGQVAPEPVIEEIVAFLRREQPDVVVTFGPEGAPTKHRDHTAICSLATMAFLFAGSAEHHPDIPNLLGPSRLCYVTWGPVIAARYATEGQPIHISVDVRAYLAKKWEAFRAHRSQQQHEAGFEKGAVTDHESFFVAAGAPSTPGATDLFADL